MHFKVTVEHPREGLWAGNVNRPPGLGFAGRESQPIPAVLSDKAGTEAHTLNVAFAQRPRRQKRDQETVSKKNGPLHRIDIFAALGLEHEPQAELEQRAGMDQPCRFVVSRCRVALE